MSTLLVNVLAAFGFYLLPVFCIIFSLNMVAIIDKIKNGEQMNKNTLWLTISFVFIVWIFASLLAVALYN